MSRVSAPKKRIPAKRTNKRYRVLCSTTGGIPRTIIAYAPSKPKAELSAIGGVQGVGLSRITGVISVELATELDFRDVGIGR